MRLLLLLTTLASICAPAAAQPHLEALPPAPAWTGGSEALLRPADHPWATDFERSGGVDSPDYATTVAWLSRLVEADGGRRLSLLSLGDSPERRPIVAVIASSEGARDFEAVRASALPCVFAHAGIHSGEIDGKDAGLMLLRDMSVSPRPEAEALLERVNFVFVPIFSVDGHERRSPHSRMNQRGPSVQGWRTTARNLNLNRDYAKADAVEMRHLLAALRACDPELYLDLHVTDGADYQYDVTYGANGPHGWSPAIATWLAGPYREALDARLGAMGHVPGPLVFLVDAADPTRGMYDWTAGPRFSTGYGDAIHLPTVLLENHSLKPYRQRVLGTYVFLSASLDVVGRGAAALRAAVASDRAARPDPVHLAYQVPADTPPPVIDFLAIESTVDSSAVSGSTVVRWNARPVTARVPAIGNRERTSFTRRPAFYYVPAAWADLGERLRTHGIAFETLDAETEIRAESLRLPDARLQPEPSEGHSRVNPGEVVAETVTARLRPGALRVPTDQPLGTLAVLLLEPLHEDSFFQWGMMLEVLQRTEYFEAYAMEPMAARMLADDPTLRAEFGTRLANDADFAADPRARLEFFYERTPYYDVEWKRYPILRSVD